MKTIQELRSQKGWTQLELANKLGVTPVTVWSWEKGRHVPSASQIRAIARIFDVRMDDVDFEGPARDSKIAA